jgi:serine phosphatase RsbU (regulator of sigma subunit)
VIATDGISEIVGSNGKRLGVGGLSQWIAQSADGASARILFEALSKEIAQSMLAKQQHDDLTLMVLTRCPC